MDQLKAESILDPAKKSSDESGEAREISAVRSPSGAGPDEPL